MPRSSVRAADAVTDRMIGGVFAGGGSIGVGLVGDPHWIESAATDARAASARTAENAPIVSESNRFPVRGALEHLPNGVRRLVLRLVIGARQQLREKAEG